MTEEEQQAADEAKVIEEAKAHEAEAAEQAAAKAAEDKRPSSVAKLLADRNAARANEKAAVERAEKAEATAAKVSELEEIVAKQALDSEAKEQKSDFFNKNSYAKEFEVDIEALRAEKNLSYEDACKLVIASKKPELLLEDAVRNQMSG